MTDHDGVLFPDCPRAGTAVCKYCGFDRECGEIAQKRGITFFSSNHARRESLE